MKHRVALIGCVRSIPQARRWLPPNCELTAICDIQQEIVDHCRAEDPSVLCTTDYRQIAASPNVDSVVTFTPNATHRDIAVAMLEGGKHVFIEKPMGVTLQQGREILEAERKSGKYVVVDLEMRALGMGPQLKAIIESGEIGEVVQLDHDHYRGGWLRTTPSGDYRTRKASSGLFKMEGIHHLDMTRYLLGEIKAVRCFSAPNVLPQYEFPDNVTAFFEFESGALGRYTTAHTRSGHDTGKNIEQARATGHQSYWNVIGTKGSMYIDAWTQHVNIFHLVADPPNTDSLKPVFDRRIDYSSRPNPMNWFHDIGGHRRQFLERMAGGLAPLQPALDAYKSEVIAYAADDAAQARDGRRVEVGPLIAEATAGLG